VRREEGLRAIGLSCMRDGNGLVGARSAEQTDNDEDGNAANPNC
jgi:hypothetical protein